MAADLKISLDPFLLDISRNYSQVVAQLPYSVPIGNVDTLGNLKEKICGAYTLFGHCAPNENNWANAAKALGGLLLAETGINYSIFTQKGF